MGERSVRDQVGVREKSEKTVRSIRRTPQVGVTRSAENKPPRFNLPGVEKLCEELNEFNVFNHGRVVALQQLLSAEKEGITAFHCGNFKSGQGLMECRIHQNSGDKRNIAT